MWHSLNCHVDQANKAHYEAGGPANDLPLIYGESLLGWLARWRSGYAAACKAVYAGSIPARASSYFSQKTNEFRPLPLMVEA